MLAGRVALLSGLPGGPERLTDQGPWGVQFPQPSDEQLDLALGVRLRLDGIEQRLEYDGLLSGHLRFHMSSILDASRRIDARFDGGAVYPDGTHVRDLVAEAEAGEASDYG